MALLPIRCKMVEVKLDFGVRERGWLGGVWANPRKKQSQGVPPKAENHPNLTYSVTGLVGGIGMAEGMEYYYCMEHCYG